MEASGGEKVARLPRQADMTLTRRPNYNPPAGSSPIALLGLPGRSNLQVFCAGCFRPLGIRKLLEICHTLGLARVV